MIGWLTDPLTNRENQTTGIFRPGVILWQMEKCCWTSEKPFPYWRNLEPCKEPRLGALEFTPGLSLYWNVLNLSIPLERPGNGTQKKASCRTLYHRSSSLLQAKSNVHYLFICGLIMALGIAIVLGGYSLYNKIRNHHHLNSRTTGYHTQVDSLNST